jgi:hypothetical protein
MDHVLEAFLEGAAVFGLQFSRAAMSHHTRLRHITALTACTETGAPDATTLGCNRYNARPAPKTSGEGYLGVEIVHKG